MKKIIITIISIITFIGCQRLDLNPLTEGNVNNWFEDEDEFELAINGLYDLDLWYPETRRIYNLDRQTDDWNERTVVYDIPAGTLSSDGSGVINAWKNLYKGVARANKIIEAVQNYQGNDISEESLNLFEGEARFFRASFYSYLIFFWGDVPYISGNISLEEAFKKGRDDKKEILKKIYHDYDIAIKYLPKNRDDGKQLIKAAAYAFKARTATWMLDFETAKKAAKKCMDLNSYSLDPDYSHLFLLSTNSSPEFIFSLPRSKKLTGKDISIKNWLPRNSGGYATAEPSWELFCSYYCTDGLPIDESPLYDPQHPFKNRDPRLSETIVPFDSSFLGYIYDPSAKEVLNTKTGEMVTNHDTKYFTQYASFNGLLLKKGVNELWTKTTRIDPNVMIMRFADVLLMYAEAKEELNEIDGSVFDALNKIRSRAYGVDITDVKDYPTISEQNQKKLRKIIRYERRVELAWENRRYFDIIRWKVADQALNRPICGIFNEEGFDKNLKNGDYFFPKGVLPIVEDNGLVNLTPLINTGKIRIVVPRKFDDREYLWPIPSTEIKINDNLTQNPGY